MQTGLSNQLRSRSLIDLLRMLWRHISVRRKKQFTLLLGLMVLASFAEVMSIGALLPFLGALTNPDRVFQYPAFQTLFQWFGIKAPMDLLFPLTLLFCFAALISGAARLVLLWSTTRLSFGAGADLSIEIYRRTLYQPYSVHVARNSSVVIAGISTKTSAVIYQVINPLLTAFSSAIILIAVSIALFTVDPLVAILTFSGFGIIYLGIIKFTKARLETNGKLIASDSSMVIKSLQEGLGGIRDVLIDGAQEEYCLSYQKADISLRKAQASNQYIGSSPRFVVEALGMILIAILALALTYNKGGSAAAIVILGIFALGAQRLLPMLQQIYVSWSSVKGSQEILQDVIDLLDQPMPNYVNSTLSKDIEFKHVIKLDGISFSYSKESPEVLRAINLEIKKGSRVGFIGVTGSGKSTLLDILMALLRPTSGFLKVDGRIIDSSNSRSWQMKIAHVPQLIYLSDASIAENIAFGVKKREIDLNRVKSAASKAQIAETIDLLPNGYETIVGERGVRLSGGQRQRIAIARAFYKQAEVIIFDEATSALDTKTETLLMESIEALSSELTVLIIAHRLSTLRQCNKIVELSSGSISGTYTFPEISKRLNIE